VVAAAVVWLIMANAPPAPPKEQPRVIKINATAPPPPPPQAQQQQTQSNAPLGVVFACHAEAFKTKTGVIICGAEAVSDQYVFIRQGWIWSSDAAVRLVGDISSCVLRIGVNMLHLNCTSPIMVVK